LVEYVDIFEGAKLAVEKVSGDVGKKIQTKLKDWLAPEILEFKQLWM
jgi:hypothetical protein